MKKRLLLLLTTLLLLCSLGGCVQTYAEADTPTNESIGYGYFTVIKDWDGYCIVYANDTKVKYFIRLGGNTYGITPLYNADGSLQLYEGE